MERELRSRARGKRKRESGESSSLSSGCEADSSFMKRAEAAAIPFSLMLQDCQLQLISNENTGGTVNCCATYSFQKAIKEIKSQQMNDYGRGQLKVVRIGMDGADIQPLPTWMENGLRFQANFEKKVATNKLHSSGDSKKRGFEIPWRGSIQLDSIPNGCAVESVQVSFICPTGDGSPTIVIHPDHGANPYYVNDKMLHIRGQTYSECCQELGIFRQATVYVKMRVPFRLLMRERLGQLRAGIPTALPYAAADAIQGLDNVVLKSGRSSLKADRESLCAISNKTKMLFAENKSGKIASVYEMKYGKDAVSVVVRAGVSKFGDFPFNPLEAQPSLLYEVMCLSLEWNVEPLKWVAQFALMERLCTLGFDVETIPLAVTHIWDSAFIGHGMHNKKRPCPHCAVSEHGLHDLGAFLLSGFIIVEQCLKASEVRGFLEGFKRETWLWSRIEDVVLPPADRTQLSDVAGSEPGTLLPFGDTICIHVVVDDGRQRTYRVKQSCPIGRIRAAIHGRLGIPSYSFRLFYDRQRMTEDDQTVADYELEHDDTIEVYIAKVGC